MSDLTPTPPTPAASTPAADPGADSPQATAPAVEPAPAVELTPAVELHGAAQTPVPEPAAVPAPAQTVAIEAPAEREATLEPTAVATAEPPLTQTPPRAKRPSMTWIIAGAAVLVVAIAAIVAILLANRGPAKVAVGDCMNSANFSSDKLAELSGDPTVPCSDPKATHKVIGIIDNQPGSALHEEVCKAYPETTGQVWLGVQGKIGKIYCLAKV